MNTLLLRASSNNPAMSFDLASLDSAACAVASAWGWLEPRFSWDSFKSFGNSAFTTSLVGALAGAYFGARSAQHVAERGKLREELTKEIRNVNAATALAFSIVNSMLTLKKQHVAALKSDYDEERTRHETYVARRKTGQIQGNAPYVLKADFRTLPVLSPPLPVLRDVVFGRLSTVGRPLNLVASLGEVIENLNTSIAQRNELIEMCNAGKLPPGANVADIYLARPYGGGHINQQYPDLVSAITSYTDDAIFFSHLLCKDLKEYGSEVATKFKKALKEPAPQVSEVDFKQAEDSGLLPTDDAYQTWATAFKKLPKATRKWWQRSA